VEGVQETLGQIALYGFSTGMVIAVWFGFIGTAVKYGIQLIKNFGG